MTAPMRSVPAMPPVVDVLGRLYRVALVVGLVKPTDESIRETHAQFAYCWAQTFADRDGKRRRVFKDGDAWRIEVAK